MNTSKGPRKTRFSIFSTLVLCTHEYTQVEIHQTQMINMNGNSSSYVTQEAVNGKQITTDYIIKITQESHNVTLNICNKSNECNTYKVLANATIGIGGESSS